jgi:hypothetical protein
MKRLFFFPLEAAVQAAVVAPVVAAAAVLQETDQ